MIELHNVTFQYSAQGDQDTPPALQDVTLHIREGETLAIIGQNGSGKSTLSRLIAGILQPHHGSILVDGLNGVVNREDLWTIRQRIGMVFQNPDDQLIASTVIDEVAFGPENLALPRQEIEERVQEALDLLELKPYAQISISELSMSLKQRVAIAGVLAMRPRYLILDEPTTMISGHTARQLLNTLQYLAHTQQIAVIHITHFMQEITSFDRVIVMDAGRVLMDGTPETIFARVEELRAVGLDVPMVTHLGRRFAAQGWTHAQSLILSSEQLLTELTESFAHLEKHQKQQGIAETPVAQSISVVEQEDKAIPPQVQKQEQPLFMLEDLIYIHQRDTPFAQPALQGLTLTISAHQFIAVVGATGSGKSTLVDVLAGLVRPHAGTFLFDGINASEASFKPERIRARVGVVFQSPELQIFAETVGKDVSFGPRQKKVSLAESRRLVQESLEAVGLPYEDFRSRYTYALSGGQRRRVAIAGVLALQPDVIIFDEPMAGLDPRGQRELFNLLLSLKQRGDLTIIYATSSLKDVVQLADKMYVLERGRVAFAGTPREILAHAEALHKLDITLPEATQVALTLREKVPALRTDIFNGEDLEAAFYQIRGGNNRPGEIFSFPLSFE
ncbi:MAG TPA: energy-coupling factor transporter ATPase [Ktedonobacteraceae bacterium]|nr:energy-coupling factor transporter ATPase [Ktedonobacteraceae bacterium]